MTGKEILEKMPYGKEFLFVDEIEFVDDNSIIGNYRFPEDSEYIRGHFPNNPIIPGVILTECMGQIGLVGLGLYLKNGTLGSLYFSNYSSEFYKTVTKKEFVRVKAQKKYFRMNILKCTFEMFTESGELIAQAEGTIKFE